MKGRSAFVTGGASGIGKDLALDLAKQGCKVSVVDRDGAAAAAVARQIQQAGGEAIAIQCDVSSEEAQQRAFDEHVQCFGGLDYALLNAGIADRGDLVWSQGDLWRKSLDVNLTAVLAGLRLAVRTMVDCKSKGVILVTASAGGLYPMPLSPVYAASKAGAVHAVRSIAEPLWTNHGIRAVALCPQFTATPLVEGMRRALGEEQAAEVMKDVGGKLLTTRQVAEAGMALLSDPSKVGTVLVVLANGAWVEPQQLRFQRLEMPRPAGSSGGVDPALREWASSPLPPVGMKVEVWRLSRNFREATRVVPMAVPARPPPGEVLVRQLWAGVNASDINYTDGRYFGGRKKAAAKLPFDAGFEAVGVVAAVGDGVTGLAVGQPVASMLYKGFAEYAVMGAKHALPVPRAAPEVVALLTSGLTASIGLEVAGRMKKGGGETVLITAAAGGTGQFAVQLAKLAGNKVVATCGSQRKAELLRRLGADRVIIHTEESVGDVLKREYPSGVDLVYESVGGEMFETCLNALAVGGRIVVIGMMSQYSSGWQPSVYRGVNEKLLMKSATVAGFFLIQYTHLFRRHLRRLAALVESGKLHVALDPRQFVGVEAVADAVEWLHSGDSAGKVVVQLSRDLPPAAGGATSKL